MLRAAGFLCLLSAGTALAQETLTSAGPQSVSVTIYRDSLAMVRETRRLDLSAHTAVIEFSGVSDGIIAPSASVSGLPARLVERNFDYDLVTPEALIRKSIGHKVRLIRTLPGSGKVSEDEATILAADEGLLLDIKGRTEAFQCSGLPEHLVFDRIPDGLRASPTLSAKLASPAAGPADAALHYLTTSLGWSASYVATLAADGRTMDLRGAITLTNTGDVPLVDAEVFAVAGDLNRVQGDGVANRGAYWFQQCWPSGPLAIAAPEIIIAPPVPGSAADAAMDQRMASRQALGDYQLYTLPVRTTVAAHQSKQVAFLAQDRVAVDRRYRVTFADLDFDPRAVTWPALILKGRNTRKHGLGEPLAQGTIHVLGTGADGPYPLAETEIADVAVGAPFEIALPETTEIQITSAVVRDERTTGDKRRRSIEQKIVNSKPVAVTVEIEQELPNAAARVTAASARTEMLGDDKVGWTVRVPARGEKTLRYTVEEVEEPAS